MMRKKKKENEQRRSEAAGKGGRECGKNHSSHLERMAYLLFLYKQTCTLFRILLKQLENKFHFAYNINFIHTHRHAKI